MRGEKYMALIKCPECENEISDKANVCPNCGYQVGDYLREEKERLEKEAQERQRKEKKEKQAEEMQVLKNKLFGSKKKRIAWVVAILLLIAVCILGYIVTYDVRSCKKYTSKLVETYDEIEEHLLDTIELNGKEVYKINANNLLLMDTYRENAELHYDNINGLQKKSFDKWIEAKYKKSFDELKEEVAEYGLDGTSCSTQKCAELLDIKREQMKEEISKRVEIVSQSLEADGNYFNYTGKIKNNTNETISYIKYTIYIYDDYGILENSEWSNWTGTLKPDATIMVDTVVKRYDYDSKKYRVEIDEYH